MFLANNRIVFRNREGKMMYEFDSKLKNNFLLLLYCLAFIRYFRKERVNSEQHSSNLVGIIVSEKYTSFHARNCKKEHSERLQALKLQSRNQQLSEEDLDIKLPENYQED